MNDREPLALMSAAERAAYCAWLKRLAGNRRGSLADHLRKSAQQLSGAFI